MQGNTKVWIGIGVGILVIVVLAVVFIFTPPKKEPEEIKIGAILPLTGEAALIGEWGTKGVKLAEEYINAQGGIKGKPLRIFIEDGMGDPRHSISAFKKLRDIEKIRVIFSIISSVDLSLIPMVKESKPSIFFLSHATHPKISGIYPLVFRHSPTVEQEVELISSFIPKNYKNISLAYMNDDYGVVLNELLTKEIVKREKILHNVMFDKGEIDFRAIVIKILETQPEFLVIAGTGRNLGQLIIKLKEAGYRGETIVTLGFVVTGAVKSAGESIKGVYGINFDINITEETYSKINQLYKSKYGSDISPGALIFFNSVLLLKEAIQNVGYSPEKLSDFLKKIRTFQGMGEKMEISERNDIMPRLKVMRFE